MIQSKAKKFVATIIRLNIMGNESIALPMVTTEIESLCIVAQDKSL